VCKSIIDGRDNKLQSDEIAEANSLANKQANKQANKNNNNYNCEIKKSHIHQMFSQQSHFAK
jgi:hypothetical protein